MSEWEYRVLQKYFPLLILNDETLDRHGRSPIKRFLSYCWTAVMKNLVFRFSSLSSLKKFSLYKIKKTSFLTLGNIKIEWGSQFAKVENWSLINFSLQYFKPTCCNPSPIHPLKCHQRQALSGFYQHIKKKIRKNVNNY